MPAFLADFSQRAALSRPPHVAGSAPKASADVDDRGGAVAEGRGIAAEEVVDGFVAEVMELGGGEGRGVPREEMPS